MKVNWRLHEYLLITWMTALVIVVSLTRESAANGLALSVLILYGAYWWLNLLIIPMGARAIKEGHHRWVRIIGVIIQFFLLAYLLGPGVNFVSLYGRFTSPRHDAFPLTLGSHPQPFLDTFGGLDISLLLLGVCFSYSAIRELLIYRMENTGDQGAYQAMISNEVTRFAMFFFAIPCVTALFQMIKSPLFYHCYFALLPPVVLVFLVAKYWLLPENEGRRFFSRRLWMPILLIAFLATLIFSVFLGDGWSFSMLLASLAANLFVFVPLSWLNYRQRKDQILQFRRAQQSLARSTAGLAMLRAQINPHFLFNALNSLYATALREKSTDTATGIQQLGDMMRFMLHDNQQDLIPMQREVEYLENYIALQRLRLQESPDMVIDDRIQAHGCTTGIAPMLLIPFVENAFKHGISLQRKSWITIKLQCEANRLTFQVRNSVHQALNNDPEKGKSGIGLQNVRERLRLLYEGNHQLSYGFQGNEFVVNLTIQTH